MKVNRPVHHFTVLNDRWTFLLKMIQIQIVLFSAMSTSKAIFMAKIELQKYKYKYNKKTKQTRTASHIILNKSLSEETS